MAPKHFLQFKDFSRDEFDYLFARTRWIKERFKRYELYQPLRDRTLAMVFEKTSTRTRVSFDAGMTQLGGIAINLNRGDTQLSRGDLIHLSLMASENRAAHALGRNYPGGVEACVIAMNAKARELGMTSAHFVEPTGLSDENVASPEDLAKLVMAAAKVAAIREYSTDSDFSVRIGRHMVRYRNTDSLVSKPDWNIVVQKTGYIHEAGRCLVMQTVIEDRPVVIVLLNSYGKRTRVADARRVRRWVEATLVAHDSTPTTT